VTYYLFSVLKLVRYVFPAPNKTSCETQSTHNGVK